MDLRTKAYTLTCADKGLQRCTCTMIKRLWMPWHKYEKPNEGRVGMWACLCARVCSIRGQCDIWRMRDPLYTGNWKLRSHFHFIYALHWEQRGRKTERQRGSLEGRQRGKSDSKKWRTKTERTLIKVGEGQTRCIFAILCLIQCPVY